METYRKKNQWSSQSRDMVESLRRYVNNSFLDAQRQEAYNLFLGNYIFAQGQPMLWELASDYYLHHVNPRTWFANRGKKYINWFDRRSLQDNRDSIPDTLPVLRNIPGDFRADDFWFEYYRPLALTSFDKLFSIKMQTTLNFMTYKSSHDGTYDPSPFRIRLSAEQDAMMKSNVIQSRHESFQHSDNSRASSHQSKDTTQRNTNSYFGLYKLQGSAVLDFKDKNDKTAATQRALNQFIRSSMNPKVAMGETTEYCQYIAFPQNLSVVVAPDPKTIQMSSYIDYVRQQPQWEQREDDSLLIYEEYLDVPHEPLTVFEPDWPKKRYTAYRKWLRGKSLFKQSYNEL